MTVNIQLDCGCTLNMNKDLRDYITENIFDFSDCSEVLHNSFRIL